jgi:hypothetical protein
VSLIHACPLDLEARTPRGDIDMRNEWLGVLGVGACLLVGCGGDHDGRGEGQSGGILSAGGTEDGGTEDGDAGDTLEKLDLPDPTGDDGGEHEECAAEVRDHLNDFSQQIIESGIDVRVVLISSYPGDGHGICIDPPLGSGGCPAMDDNPPLFTHIDQRVGSRNGLSLLIDHHETWAPLMRPEASLHLMNVTDDDANIDAIDFDTDFKALDPSHVDYKLHCIVCLHNCPEAARVGDVYIELGQMTGGLLGDLCDQDFQPIFDLLATEVIAGSVLGCEWDLPAPPEGEELDPDAVNVEFDDGSGGEPLSIGRVDDPSECANVTDGWYHDDPMNPTTILACPQTCDKIQGAMSAKISVSMGCATIPAG